MSAKSDLEAYNAKLADLYKQRTALSDRIYALEALIKPLAIADHRRQVRARKWVYLVGNFLWRKGKGPQFGDKLRVYKHGRDYCDVLYRGKRYAFKYSELSADPPNKDTAKTNRLFAKIVDKAGL